jgi:hypothetical protein
MANELPYLPSYKNVGKLFEKIQTAKIPETFTHKFLINSLGLKSTGDRALINLLKNLGFLESTGKPSSTYSSLKNDKVAAIEIAKGIKEAYRPLFDANESAHTLDPSDLKGLVAQVSGADTPTITKIVGTLKALIAKSDFSSASSIELPNIPIENIDVVTSENSPPQNLDRGKGMRPEFHYNIQVHLPSNGTEETYMNIFNSIRKVFE